MATTTVEAASGALAASMRNLAAPGPGVCPVCRAFHDPSRTECRGCGSNPNRLDALACITYAPNGSQVYTALRDYKNGHPQVQRHHAIRLAAVLWRFLEAHEQCVAHAAGVSAFDVVTVVPSKTKADDDARDWLRVIVGQWVGITKERYARVLRPNDPPIVGRFYSPGRFVASAPLDGQRVLLIDDTWVSGSTVQSAADALRQAGAANVSCVAIGRYLRRDYQTETWGPVGPIYDKLPKTFDWTTCAVHT